MCAGGAQLRCPHGAFPCSSFLHFSFLISSFLLLVVPSRRKSWFCDHLFVHPLFCLYVHHSRPPYQSPHPYHRSIGMHLPWLVFYTSALRFSLAEAQADIVDSRSLPSLRITTTGAWNCKAAGEWTIRFQSQSDRTSAAWLDQFHHGFSCYTCWVGLKTVRLIVQMS